MMIKRFNKKKSFLSVFRVPTILCLLTCISLYILSYFIERSFEDFTVSQNVTELHSVIDSIENELSYFNSQEVDRNDLIQNIMLILASHHRLFVYIVDDKQNILYKTRGPNLFLTKKQINLDKIIVNKNTAIWNHDHSSYRLAASTFTDNGGTKYKIIVAVSRDLQLEFTNRLHDGLTILIAISCLLTLIGTMLSIYLTQKPINLLIKKIESINTRSLDYRIPESLVPPKYVSLVEAFNKMIAHIEDVFQRQNDFTADIAHEMRTPITNLTTQTQIALSNARDITEYQEILYSNLEEYERLSQMISDMLFLAQADNKQLIPQLITIDFHEMISTIFEYYEPLSEDRNITLKLEGNCSSIQGDRLMISRAIGNLLSNAIRYTAENETVTVTLEQLPNNNIKIIIANPGKIIDAKHIQHIFDRFYRTDESRQRNGEGAGIGLAIVKSIIQAHKGYIYAESDKISTRFMIFLPESQDLDEK